MYFNSEQVVIYMNVEFNLNLNEEEIAEESVYLTKEEVDVDIIGVDLLELLEKEICLDMCSFNLGKDEWLLAVAHDVTYS